MHFVTFIPLNSSHIYLSLSQPHNTGSSFCLLNHQSQSVLPEYTWACGYLLGHGCLPGNHILKEHSFFLSQKLSIVNNSSDWWWGVSMPISPTCWLSILSPPL